MDSITKMDLIRARLVKYPEFKATFYSHITNEFSIAEKKFKLFSKSTEQNEQS